MSKRSPWISPFWKQCFVTVGVIFNSVDCGLIFGFTTCLLTQLRDPDSSIAVDDSSASWIATISSMAMIPSTFIVPIIMDKYGRRVANIISISLNIIGWIIIATATNVASLLIAGLLQGFALALTSIVAPALIGEYTSPVNRGTFLTAIALAVATGMLCVQALGLHLHWQLTALICACFAFVDLMIVIYSPESPSWLIDQGRYEESKTVFRWLRGDSEGDELMNMIEANIVLKEHNANKTVRDTLAKKIKSKLIYCLDSIKKPEFYKPIIIMIHFYAMLHWSGFNAVIAYAVDVFDIIMGNSDNTSLIIISIGVQRIISSICAMYVIKKVKRRTMLLATVSMNIGALLAIAAYTYAKSHNSLPFDHVSIGISLIHIHVISIAVGTANIPFIIAGELFPLEYRGLASCICLLTASPNIILSLKTVPFFLRNIGLYGMYCMYAGIVSYCLVVICTLLPETKDKTLQDIEDEFRGRKTEIPLTCEELKCLQPLSS